MAAIEFVREQLSNWRNDPSRPRDESENRLNASLCMFLNSRADKLLPLARFLHESPETGRHAVDMGVHPVATITVDGRSHSIYQPFLAIEGKRLPAPSRDREREYVSGGDRHTGGVQRFKLGLHGAKLPIAAMIGYVQQGTSAEWFETINRWIDELAASESVGAVGLWTVHDRLRNFSQRDPASASSCDSTHMRYDATTDQIRLYHLWIRMSEI